MSMESVTAVENTPFRGIYTIQRNTANKVVLIRFQNFHCQFRSVLVGKYGHRVATFFAASTPTGCKMEPKMPNFYPLFVAQK